MYDGKNVSSPNTSIAATSNIQMLNNGVGVLLALKVLQSEFASKWDPKRLRSLFKKPNTSQV